METIKQEKHRGPNIGILAVIFPKLIYLIPLTRFPGFIWLIIAGFMLPRSASGVVINE